MRNERIDYEQLGKDKAQLSAEQHGLKVSLSALLQALVGKAVYDSTTPKDKKKEVQELTGKIKRTRRSLKQIDGIFRRHYKSK